LGRVFIWANNIYFAANNNLAKTDALSTVVQKTAEKSAGKMTLLALLLQSKVCEVTGVLPVLYADRP